MATIDLLNLIHELDCECDFLVSLPLLMSYGMDESAAARLATRAGTYCPNKHTRNRHRAECRLRNSLAQGKESLRTRLTVAEHAGLGVSPEWRQHKQY